MDFEDFIESLKNDIPQLERGPQTIQDVFDTLNEEQKNVVYYMVGEAMTQSRREALLEVETLILRLRRNTS